MVLMKFILNNQIPVNTQVAVELMYNKAVNATCARAEETVSGQQNPTWLR